MCDHLRDMHKRVAMLEFDRERKLMSVMATRGSEKVLFVKGAPESVLRRCTMCQGDAGAHHPTCICTASMNMLCKISYQTSVQTYSLTILSQREDLLLMLKLCHVKSSRAVQAKIVYR
jgi:magnesium-transporting ATPase (P-type)